MPHGVIPMSIRALSGFLRTDHRLLPRLFALGAAGAGLIVLSGCHMTCRCVAEATSDQAPDTMVFGAQPTFSTPSAPTSEPPGIGPRYVGLLEDIGAAYMTDEGAVQTDSSLTQVSFASEGADFDPTIAPAGGWMAYASTQHAETADIYRKQIDGRTMVRLTSDPAEDVMPAISPDGRWIAFSSNRAGNWDVWLMPAEGGAATQLTSESDDELHPAFSPDGSRITYCRRNTRSDRWEIWTFELDRPGARTYVCDGLFPQWSPDPTRNTLLFQRARERGSRFYGIWTVEFRDGQAMSPTEIVSASDAAIMHPAWSPDGASICFCSVVRPEGATAWSEQADLWVIGVDGTGRTALTDGRYRNMQPTWSPSGRIFFVSDRGGSDCLWSVSSATTGARFDTGTLAIGEDDSDG